MDLENRISSVENRLFFTLTRSKLENSEHNFSIEQKIKDSEIITFNSTPSEIRIDEEDKYADFSVFGHFWKQIQSINVNCIDLSQNGKYCIASAISGGLYLSLDFGNSWIQLIDDTVTTDIVYNSVCISADGSFLIATSSIQTVISRDFGNTWSVISNILSSNNYSSVISCDNKTIYISDLTKVNISKDYGVSWKSILYNVNYISSSSNCQICSFFKREMQSPIYYSNDFGKTLIASNSPNKIWICLKISSTGQYQTAISNDFITYVSSNYGIDWIQSNSILHSTLINISMSASGKYQLISGDGVYISKDYGVTWRTYFSNGDYMTDYICLSNDGKIGIMCSNERIFLSTITTEYIKESGSSSFTPLDKSLFAIEFAIDSDKIDDISSFSLYTSLQDNFSKNSSSRYGKYKSICVHNGNIWVSKDYGITYNIANPTDNKNWSSISISDSGKYQTATITEGEIWRSDDYGLNFFKVDSSTIGGFNINDVKISGNGKYQTVCGDGGNIGYSSDFGYTWICSTICSNNLISICMSKNGKNQSVCGSNDDSNSVMYSKTYGILWKYSNLSNSGVQWKNISCSGCGQYQTLCSYETSIMISEDFGINWNQSLSGDGHNWCLVYVTYDGQRQIACDYGSNIFLSLDFGFTWNSCSSDQYDWRSISISDTLQFIDIIYQNGILVSKIYNDDKIPGFITIPAKTIVNNNAIILLSGNSSNTYSYITDDIKFFDIVSSDFEDSGKISYLLLDYGQNFD